MAGNILFKWLLAIHLILKLVLAEHPMLFFNSDDVIKYRHKAKTTHVKIAKVIEEAGRSLKEDPKYYMPPESFEKFGSRWNELYGNNLCAFAMYCVLYPEDTQALKLVKLYMDRMASYPDWYVTASRNVDQVPIGHSLTGFATAFDFLYPHFSQTQTKMYLKKIGVETARMYDIIKRKRAGWVKQHIHNHAPTNLLSILLGAMVYEVHYTKEDLPWKKTAIFLLEKAMKLFSYIVDGSCDEGVAYGSYTSRGMTQYIYLALRHFNIDHTDNPWLREHFWFYFATTMPGYQRSVGIADSNHNWFYGPESQLVFLDAFVMRNGYGNWLADRVRGAKPKNPPLARSMSQKWSTVHTEFIFYDASIKAIRPVFPSGSPLHVFHDWGVATYGGGQYLKKGNTFLSFKSGPIHGQAVADIVENNLLPSLVNGWSNFNAGHEHADQNTFVFAPNGRYFITEALYAVKHAFLNNAITFSPSADSECNPPWEGQVGECSKWLNYRHVPVPRGKITTVTSSDHLVHMAGEAANSYRSELGLKSVQRSLLLMDVEVLLVVDSIYLEPDSELQRASAYFHNILHPFHPYRHLGYQGAQVIYPEGPYAFFWLQPNGKSPNAQLTNQAYASDDRMTNYVNVTFQLRKDAVTRIAFVFIGPHTKVSSVSFLKESNNDISHIAIQINDVEYKVSIASSMMSLTSRIKQLGFGGFARVASNDDVRMIGVDKKPMTLNRCDVTDRKTAVRFVRSLITSRNLTVDTEVESVETTAAAPSERGHFWVIYVLVFACIVLWVRRRAATRWKYLLAVAVIWMFSSWYFFCTDCTHAKERKSNIPCHIINPIETFGYSKPTIVIVSLPGFGGELVEMLFQNSTDFLCFSTADVTIPSSNDDVTKFDPCYWPDSDVYSTTAGWFSSLSAEPLLFLNNIPESNRNVEKLRRKFRSTYKQGRFVVNLMSGFWNSKLPWLKRAIGNDMKVIAVIRDPRDWIYSLMRDDLPKDQQRLRQKWLQTTLSANVTCAPPSTLTWEYRGHVEGSTTEVLSNVWAANIASMIRNGRSMQIVRLEDLITDPENASASIMRRFGLTISVPLVNDIARAVRSGHHNLDYEGLITPPYVGLWKENMPQDNVAIIESICGDMMHQLGYT